MTDGDDDADNPGNAPASDIDDRILNASQINNTACCRAEGCGRLGQRRLGYGSVTQRHPRRRLRLHGRRYAHVYRRHVSTAAH